MYTLPFVHAPPGQPNLRATLWAGVVASLVFQLLEMILIPLFGGGSPWGPARMIAAMVLGPGVLPPPATFDPFIVGIALLIDILQSIIYAALLALIIGTWPTRAAVLGGAVFGAVLYVVNFYGFTWLFPWFVAGRHWVTLFTHVVFSVTVAITYKRLQAGADDRA